MHLVLTRVAFSEGLRQMTQSLFLFFRSFSLHSATNVI